MFLFSQVFPPSFRELPPPPLELFDLDDAFSSIFSRLAQFTNKYAAVGTEQGDRELDFYIRECAKIVRLDVESGADAKEILYNVGVQCAQYKSIDTIK